MAVSLESPEREARPQTAPPDPLPAAPRQTRHLAALSSVGGQTRAAFLLRLAMHTSDDARDGNGSKGTAL